MRMLAIVSVADDRKFVRFVPMIPPPDWASCIHCSTGWPKPIEPRCWSMICAACGRAPASCSPCKLTCEPISQATKPRSEEHTSELQSHVNLVCRLLLEKKKKT